jgi:Phage Mu protein F like protein
VRIQLAKIERLVLTPDELRKRDRTYRKHRKLRGAPRAYLEWLDVQGGALAEKIHEFFRVEAVRLSTYLPHQLGLSKAVGKPQAYKIVNDLSFDSWDQLSAMMRNNLKRAYSTNVKQGLISVGVSGEDLSSMLDLADPNAVAWAQTRAAELIGRGTNNSITDTTRAELRDLVTIAVDDGWSSNQLAREIEDGWQFSRARAETVAKTELASAHSQGNLEGWRQSGVVESKQWVIGSEHDQDDECDGNADDGPIDLDAAFSSGDDGPPAHPNCNCDLVPIVSKG